MARCRKCKDNFFPNEKRGNLSLVYCPNCISRAERRKGISHSSYYENLNNDRKVKEELDDFRTDTFYKSDDSMSTNDSYGGGSCGGGGSSRDWDDDTSSDNSSNSD